MDTAGNSGFYGSISEKDNGQWLNLTEEGFAFCDEEGLYVSNQSMTAGNTYSILVTYDNGKKQTGTLRFRYLKDGSLNIYSYQYSQIGDIQKPGNCIRSYDTSDEKYLSRCAAYAVKTGANLKKIKEELTEDINFVSVQLKSLKIQQRIRRSCWSHRGM